MERPLTEKVVAFIDLGTNSARLLIVRLNPNFSYSILRREKETVRLGENEFKCGFLTESSMQKALIVCRQFVEISKIFGAEEIIAVATSATREASNKDEFLSRMEREARLSLDVISGTEEARLIYLGVSNGVHIGFKNHLFIDIGGGSTEVIIGDQFHYHMLISLKLGAIRTTNRFIPENYTGKVENELFENIQGEVIKLFPPELRKIKSYNIKSAFGSSGTIQTLVDLKNRVDGIETEIINNETLTRNELLNIIHYLCDKNLEERKAVPGIKPERADIIVAGAIILFVILKETGINTIKASDKSLRDGLLVDYLSKIPGFPHAEYMSVRNRSIRQLGRSCRIDENHAENVIRLSLLLFDSAKEAGLHNFGDREKEILEYSAYLHDIGQFISFSRHQNHSYYVITNSPLPGFNPNDIEMIGLIARYHRKKMPKKSDLTTRKLKKEDQKAVIILSFFLRMAEHMERSHDGRVKKAVFSTAGNEIVLEIKSAGRCDFELWSLEEDIFVFKQIFEKDIFINVI